MTHLRLLLTVLIALHALFANAQSIPQVSIAAVLIDSTDYSNVEVHYNLQSDFTDSVAIYVLHSNDGGASFTTVTNLTGDYGKPVADGTRMLTYQSSTAATQLEDIRVKISAVSSFSPSIADMVAEVESANLYQMIAELEGDRNYVSNPNRMDSIKDYLEIEMSTFVDVERLQFDFGALAAENFVSSKCGLIDPMSVAVNGAHFDGVSGAPGADDNASGTAAVIEVARILSQYQFENSLRFLLFDLEELGLRGSIDYVNNDLSPDESLLGVIVNEMLAYSDSSANSQQFPTGFNLLFPDAYNEVAADSFRGNFITNVGNTASAGLMASYKSAAQQYVPILRVVNVETPGNSQAVQDLRRSDHAPFWDAGYQALMITDGANFRNPNYHEASDSLSTLDLNFMTAVVKANVATLASLAVPIIAGTDESVYTAVVGIESIESLPNQCITVKTMDSGRGQSSKFRIESCEAITNFDIQVMDISGRKIPFDLPNKIDDFQLNLEFQSKTNVVFVICGAINGQKFTKRVVR
jgi:hypothetical protein